jgi:hypothetical protein
MKVSSVFEDTFIVRVSSVFEDTFIVRVSSVFRKINYDIIIYLRIYNRVSIFI